MAQPVSLLDLFPSLVDIAGGAGPEPATPLDGKSLLPLLEGGAEDPAATVAGEYLAEAAAGPLVMLRRGHHKYVVGVDSPAQLFDLAADPLELHNKAGSPDCAELEAGFAAEVAARWDFAGLTRDVVASQRRRLQVFAAARAGAAPLWDYQPFIDASKIYARNSVDILGNIEGSSRIDYPD